MTDWQQLSTAPEGIKVLVKMEDNTEAIGILDSNFYRTCWMIQDKITGLFWRNIIGSPVILWKPIS